jgi:RNA polymerase sigma-70 factor (ECF subfamily)
MRSNSSTHIRSLLQHEAYLKRLARGLSVDEFSADDLIQEVWLTALRYPPRHAGNLRGWLSRVTHALAGRAQRAGSRLESELVEEPGIATHPAALVATESMRRSIAQAVLELQEPYREVVLLRYFEELGVAEVATRLGESPNTVKTRLRRALNLLRRRTIECSARSRTYSPCPSGLRPSCCTGRRVGRHWVAPCRTTDTSGTSRISASASREPSCMTT